MKSFLDNEFWVFKHVLQSACGHAMKNVFAEAQGLIGFHCHGIELIAQRESIHAQMDATIVTVFLSHTIRLSVGDVDAVSLFFLH